MGTVFQYLRNHIKLAAKSVFFNIKQYIIFFAALFIAQCFFGLITVSAVNNDDIEYQHVTSEYDYHMLLKDLTADQAYFLINDELAVFKSDHVFEVVRYDVNTRYLSNDEVYDVYIYFTGDDLSACESKLRTKYFPELANLGIADSSFRVSTTPLMTFNSNLAANHFSYAMLVLLVTALSVFLLMSLYNIRVNQYKFLYGIYMTFGADFRKLFSTAFWELFVVSIITFLPATGASALAIFFIYKFSGYIITFSPWIILFVFLFSTLIVAIAVFFPMRVMSVRWPMTLIVAQDNSNLVSSPYRSFKMYNRKFPLEYELMSVWRFRKYNLNLLFTAVIFSALFICGLYMAAIYNTDLQYPRPQFTVDLSGTSYYYDDIMADELKAIDNVTEVRIASSETTAKNLGSHILIPSENVRAFANMVVSSDIEGYRITNDVSFSPVTDYTIDTLEKYSYDGDLNSVLENDNYIIIGDSISNVRKCKFKVGDQIQIAVKTGQIRAVDYNVTGKALLRSQLDYFTFEYETYTIGAILYDIPSENLPIFLNVTDFEAVIGSSFAPRKLEVYLDYSTSAENIESTYAELRSWGRTYGDTVVTNNHAINLHNIEKDKNYQDVFVIIAILILLISPLVWFFSQTLYYMKREGEFNILQGLGAVLKEIRWLHVQGGFSMGLLSFIFCVVLAYVTSYGLFYIYNVIMPYFTQEFVRYEFYMPWYAILTSVVVSVACGFLSAYLPYKNYVKNRMTLEMGGGEYGDS